MTENLRTNRAAATLEASWIPAFVDMREATGHPIRLVPPPDGLPKRAMDVLGATLLLLILTPLLLVLALLVAATSEGPVFFRQRRFGRHGAPYSIIKFRTMHADSDRRLAQLLENPAARDEFLATAKLKEDPRVTPIGRFLRRTSLDELPQLWNVLKGDMSLVGPRPLAHDFELRWYGARVGELLSVRPGMTGPWQVSGRNLLSAEDRVRLDLQYAERATLVRDAGILIRTAWVVLAGSRSGAC